MQKASRHFVVLLALIASLTLYCAAEAAQPKTIPGVSCTASPLQHCGPECNDSTMTNVGNAYEPNSGREFFLDYPCDLKKDEKVIFILNLHGAGSTGNWQRHYFPAVDYKEKHRLVVATPTAATVGHIPPFPIGFRVWDPAADDRYLEDIVSFVLAQFGRKSIQAFWLAGHSQGGITANRIACSDFFKDKVDGWLSLSGGRIGAVLPSRRFDSVHAGSGAPVVTPFGDAITPTCNISHIFVGGELEIMSLPESSPWADKYKCSKRLQADEVTDSVSGYVTAGDRQDSAQRPHVQPPHTAKIFVYPHCKKGKLVADVFRLNRDHNDGLGPKVTESIIELIESAPGGKAQEFRWR